MSESEDDSIGRRETAYRLFASEFEDADFSYAESDEERAPNYVVTPTGARINRLFVVGVLTEVQPVSDDVLRARVVDPTGAYVVYAGQYQPDAQAFLERADPPTFVAVSGKARTFQPEDSDVTYTSIRPESVNEVDADTRDRWVVGTAEQTLDRISNVASALRSDVRGDDLRSTLQANGVSEGLAAGIPLAIDHYGTGGGYLEALRETALDAARVVAGDLDEVEPRSVAPDASGDVDLSTLTDRRLDTSGVTAAEPGGESPAGAVSEAVESTADSRAGSATSSDSTDSPSEPTTADSSASSESESDGIESESEPAAVAAETGSESASDSTEADSETAASDNESAATESEGVRATQEADADTSSTAESDEDIGDFEPGEFDLDEETREEVESEYGTEFQSGSEVDEPGEADIETPDADELAEAESAGAPADAADAEAAPESPGAPAGTESATPDESDATSEAVTETPETDAEAGAEEVVGDAEEGAESLEDIDLEDAVMDAMRDLDDGDGADRDAVAAAVVEQYGADPGDVEDAIQDALMNGRCYEPDDETLTPI